MFFVGSGSLLSQAVGYALAENLAVEQVYCPFEDSSIPRLRRQGATIVETDNPNDDLLRALNIHGKANVFSINNAAILSDELLSSGSDFFNIHNGLVQRYRGIAEVCIFAALCHDENEYGVTLHKLLPRQKVDTGPVIDQISFPIEKARDDFAQVMSKSLRCCQTIFEKNVRNIRNSEFEAVNVGISDIAYSYKSLSRLVRAADPSGLGRACRLGGYEAFFPRLASFIESSVQAGRRRDALANAR